MTPAPRPAATLELLYDGEVILVQADDVVVGRTARCTVRVVHPLVSREHCRIEARPDGLFVVDLDAVNGTWLNGTRVVGRAQARAGDKLGLGREGAVLVVRRAVVADVDVSRLPREEDMNTMVAGDPRARGAVARVEVAPEALPALGVGDEPTTRAADETRRARPQAPQAPTVEAPIPIASVLPTGELPPTPAPAAAPTPAPDAPAPDSARVFVPGLAVGFVLGLAIVAALAKFTPALDAVRAKPAQGGAR